MIILGIETSCDETAAAIVNSNYEILSESIHSQIKIHEKYLGVVPELAARSHVDYCDKVVFKVLEEANLSIFDLDAVAATAGPGLIGGLLVGLTTAKAIALAANKPFLAINHLDAHALMPRFINKLDFPYMLLLISGGHSMFLSVEAPGKYQLLGQSIDDALGEAYDKTGRLLGLGYPGGPAIEKLSTKGQYNKFNFPQPLKGRKNCDFSFSGLKTSVRQLTEKLTPLSDQDRADIASSFQHTICKIIEEKTEKALNKFSKIHPNSKIMAASGGVASNKKIKEVLNKIAKKYNFDLIIPPPKLCTDNGTMIAWAGIEHRMMGYESNFNFDARAKWSLGDKCYEI